MIITHPKSLSSFFQVNCYCQLSSQGLPNRSRFLLLLLYWENSSHQEWTFSTSLPSTCTLIYSHTHRFLLLSCLKGMNVPIPSQDDPFSMLAHQTLAVFSFLEPHSISYSLFYLWSLPLHYPQPEYKLQSPLHTKSIPSQTNVYTCTCHLLPCLPNSSSFLTPDMLDLDFRTLLTTNWTPNCQIQSPIFNL